MRKLFLGMIVMSLISNTGDECGEISSRSMSEIVLLSAIGDALAAPNEFKGQSTQDNLINWRVSTLKNAQKRVPLKMVVPYTDDTAMAVIVLDTLYDFKQANMKEAIVTIELESLTALHDYLKNVAKTNDTMPISAEQTNILNFFGDSLARKFVDYYSYWAAPHRAPGIGCVKAIRGDSSEKNQEGRDSVSRKISNKQTNQILWWNCGEGKVNPRNLGGGNGAIMRTYPCAILFHEMPEFAAALSLIQSHITHSADVGVIPTVVFTYALAKAFNKKITHQNVSWSVIVEDLKKAASNLDSKYAYVYEQFYQQGLVDRKKIISAENYIEAFASCWDNLFDYSGDKEVFGGISKVNHNTWTGVGALNAALYMMTLFGESKNPAQALQWAAHIKGDSDSVGTLVGSFLSVMYTLEDLQQKEIDFPITGVFSNSLLSERSLYILEDYELLRPNKDTVAHTIKTLLLQHQPTQENSDGDCENLLHNKIYEIILGAISATTLVGGLYYWWKNKIE